MALNEQPQRGPFPAGNPLANVLVVIAGILVISLSLALGFVVFMIVGGFVLVMAAFVGIRNWWYRRRGVPPGPGAARKADSPMVIEGEYREVRRRDDS